MNRSGAAIHPITHSARSPARACAVIGDNKRPGIRAAILRCLNNSAGIPAAVRRRRISLPVTCHLPEGEIPSCTSMLAGESGEFGGEILRVKDLVGYGVVSRWCGKWCADLFKHSPQGLIAVLLLALVGHD